MLPPYSVSLLYSANGRWQRYGIEEASVPELPHGKSQVLTSNADLEYHSTWMTGYTRNKVLLCGAVMQFVSACDNILAHLN